MSTEVFAVLVNYNDGADKTLYFSSGEIGDVEFKSVIEQTPDYDRSVGAWHWGTQSGGSIGQIQIINIGGDFDDWIGYAVRDKKAVLYIGAEGADISTYTVVSRALIDRVEFPSEERMRIVLKDPLGRLDKPFQSDFYDNTVANSELEALPYPICLGHCYQVRAAEEDPVKLYFDVHNSRPADTVGVQSNGNPATGSQFTEPGGNRRGFTVTVGSFIDGRITAEVKGEPDTNGAFNTGTEEVTNGNFSSWTSDNPNNWTVTENGTTSLITQSPSGQCSFLHVSGFSFPSIAQPPGLTVDVLYQLSFDLNNIPSGSTLTVSCSGTTVATYTNADGTGTKTVDFTANADNITFTAVIFGASFVTIDNVSIKEKYFTTALDELDELTEHILSVMGWPSDEIDSTAISALNTAIGSHELGYYTDRVTTGRAILQTILDPFVAWAYVDNDGDFQLGRLAAPSSGSITITESKLERGRPVIVEPDNAPYLTDTYAGRPNWYPIPVESSAGGLTEQEKQTVAADYRIIRQSSNTLDDYYSFAANSCPMGVVLQDETSIEREIDRLIALYPAGTQRHFYTVTALFETDELPAIELGSSVTLQLDRYGLDAGKDLLVIGIRGQYLNRSVQLRLWG